MKHTHVAATLTTAERIAPFAVLIDPDHEPLPEPTRVGLMWDGLEWAEIDVETGDVLARGTIGDRELRS